MRLLRELGMGPGAGPGPALIVVVMGGPKLLVLLLTLPVGLDGVMLVIESDRPLICLPQSLHSHALDSRCSTISLRTVDRCSASSLYSACEDSLWRARLWNILNWVADSRLRASC